MIKTYKHPNYEAITELLKRPAQDNAEVEKSVRKILKQVKVNGDKTIRKFSKKFDGFATKKLLVTPKEISAAAALLSDDLKKAILQAKQNIQLFHSSQLILENKIETMAGVTCWRTTVGIEKVGLYIPGGTAPLFSTVLMLGIPASIAGCKQVILCTPPRKDGTIHPAILFAAEVCGIKEIYKVGGAQAIAAMAYGTETIPRVFKIFGPGNSYVTMAKQLVQLDGAAIDMPAGPSELLVIADETAVPSFVAADLLSQAEHSPDSQVILITTSEGFAGKVNNEVTDQLKKLPRSNIATTALEHSKIIVVENLNQAIAISNQYAPEHLVLAIADADNYLCQVTAAGSVFLGNYSPESAGDYASGTNHTLPTNGYAAMHSGVSVDSFVKKITWQRLTETGLENIGETVMQLAAEEGLEAHRNAIAIRLKK